MMALCYLFALYASVRSLLGEASDRMANGGRNRVCGWDGREGIDGDGASDDRAVRPRLCLQPVGRRDAREVALLCGAGGHLGAAAGPERHRAALLHGRLLLRRQSLDLPARSDDGHRALLASRDLAALDRGVLRAGRRRRPSRRCCRSRAPGHRPAEADRDRGGSSSRSSGSSACGSSPPLPRPRASCRLRRKWPPSGACTSRCSRSSCSPCWPPRAS